MNHLLSTSAAWRPSVSVAYSEYQIVHFANQMPWQNVAPIAIHGVLSALIVESAGKCRGSLRWVKELVEGMAGTAPCRLQAAIPR